MIAVDGVTKSYGAQVVVDDVSVELATAGVTAIIGPNGAGKSTLLGMIARLLPFDAGRIEVEGLDVAATKSAVIARRLAILKQENHLVTRLTVDDLVAFGRFPHTRGRLTADDREAVDRAIDYLDLAALRGRYLDELSGGQRQRAFIAMVLAQDTEYVLLDEPLNSLDLRHAVEIMRVLERTSRELGKRIVVVLHDINFASHYADQLVAMKDGRIYRQGAPEHVMTPEVLSGLYDMPVDVEVVRGKRVAVYYD